jgi:hypothetical protein
MATDTATNDSNRIRLVGQDPGQMCRVGRRCLGSPVGLVAARWQVFVVGLVHGLAHPVRHTAGGDAESHVIKPLEQLGTDVERTVFVANDGDDGHPVK